MDQFNSIDKLNELRDGFDDLNNAFDWCSNTIYFTSISQKVHGYESLLKASVWHMWSYMIE